ncbi:MAG TPA: dTDP-4-amino-4,6-dideoxyglucose formyltransferase [Chitinophagales bacterium]|nr:dTDP-4-amino-4,6-dideoxyglucose formyltransferase [Chitinophagales bacterium]
MYYYKNILVVSDNGFLIKAFHDLIAPLQGVQVTYTCSPQNTALLTATNLPVPIRAISMKADWEQFNYDLIFSLHCKQLFPAGLVNKTKCINVHPGFNPYNRGWFPQVFSILNGHTAGATIHEIDEQLDHGAIIAQREIKIEAYDTSLTAYEKIQQCEVELLRENLRNILFNTYTKTVPAQEGNVNLKKDFNKLTRLDLDEKLTMREAIDRLRALTHGEYKNAWFTDPTTQERIYISVNLEKQK